MRQQSTRQPRILVVRALRGLGDFLCITPALRALRTAQPGAHVTLLGLPEAQSFVQRVPHLIDGFLEFPGFPGIPEVPANVRAFPAFLQQVQGRFNLALQMQGSGAAINPFVELLAADRMGGFYRPPDRCPDTGTFLPYPHDLPEPHRWLRLTEHLGSPACGDHLEFPLHPQDALELRALHQLDGLRGAYAVIHPGAHDPQRRWDAAGFAQIADALSARGLQVVLTGSANERALTQEIAASAFCQPINLAGLTGLGALGALLQHAALLVSNDTGVSHLAAAIGTPSVVVFSRSDRQRWAPTHRQLHRAVGAGVVDGEPLESGILPSPEEVLAEVNALLCAGPHLHSSE